MKKPVRLYPGDTIGVVAPSSPVPESDLQAGIALLEARGYHVVTGENVLAHAPHCDYLAGTDAQRASDLNEMLTRSDIDAVFCARGGYGSMRLLGLLDWEAIAKRPRVFVGYSDITSLHTALAKYEWVTIHATMVTSLWKLDARIQEMFWGMLEDPDFAGELPDISGKTTMVVAGEAEGELAGGNLCLLAQSCGTRFAPNFKGKIVMLEDVNGAVYHADRNLTQLLNAGILQEAAGFVLGSLTGWEKHENETPLNTPESLWKEFFSRLGKPTIADFPFGHEPDPLPIPLGVKARLNASEKTLTLLEGAVVSGSTH